MLFILSERMDTSSKFQKVVLKENLLLGDKTFVLKFRGCGFLRESLPGQFVMMRGARWGTDPLLPRAFSILSVVEDEADILIKTFGKASELLEKAQPGEEFYVLGPLGNSFPLPKSEHLDWLVAGGVGLAPLYMQALFASKAGFKDNTWMFYGGRQEKDLVLLDEISEVVGQLKTTTEDGSVGDKGFVTHSLKSALDAHEGKPPRLLVCGPDPMLEAVAQLAHAYKLEAHLSLEGEMACGVGACLVCAVPCKTKAFRYTCVDGPVFPLDELQGVYARLSETAEA